MAAGKEIRTQINSVRNTQKITSAMEMVAASKMRRTQDKMREGGPYATKIRAVISHLASAFSEYRHPYMKAREIRRVGYLVVSTDKGLCGGLNVNLFRTLVRTVKAWQEKNTEVDFGLIGKKAQGFFRAVGGNVVSAATDIGEDPDVAALIGNVKVMLDAYDEARIDALFVASNDFVNTMTQAPVTRQLLPLPLKEEDKKREYHWDYLYEPEAADLIEGLIQRYVESQVYQAVVENVACEQAAKMLAMKNATDNAGELIDDLQLLYNNVRQASITQEISEIVGGAAAV